MNFQIQPLVALCDQKLSITISKLPAFGKVKISASMSLPWAPKLRFESCAYFTADSEGNLDLSKQKPDSAKYTSADSMGLIVSLKLASGKIKELVKGISVDNSFFIDFQAECEKEKSIVKVERQFKKAEVKRLKLSDEFVGELFYTENTNYPTIVTLGGSDGNSAALSLISALLASHEYNVLSLAYFNEKGLPKRLSEIPLEYFEKAFKWLGNNPITAGKDLYVHGTSKGGELALLLAAKYSFIKKVVAFSPHAYCFQGLSYKNASSWSCQGKSTAFIRIKNSTVIKDMLECFIKKKPFGYTYSYKKSLLIAQNKDEARIKIGNAEADILLVAGAKDNIWNSYDGCVEIIDTLKKQNNPNNCTFLAYENAGHPFHLPYIIPESVLTSSKLMPRLTFNSGGTSTGNIEAQVDSWEKTLEFLK